MPAAQCLFDCGSPNAYLCHKVLPGARPGPGRPAGGGQRLARDAFGSPTFFVG